MIEVEPSRSDFVEAYAKGRAQLVWTRRISDLETPVSALIKLGADNAGAFLFESVEGGDWRGRYSIIGLKPDMVWRVVNGRVEKSRGGFDDESFRPLKGDPIAGLRKAIGECALAIPPSLPPMAAGLFGYLGYDMIRYVEKLPAAPPDTLGVPEAVLMRPTIVAIFDNVGQEITLVTPVRPSRMPAERAFDLARTRLESAMRLLDRPNRRFRSDATPNGEIKPTSNTTENEYRGFVARAKQYARAGDIFQVVPSQRFEAPFEQPPFCALPLAAADQPLAVPVLSELQELLDRRLLARKSWCGCAMTWSPSALSPARARAAPRPPKTRAMKRTCWPIRKSARSI